ncbi:MAG: protein-export rane protein SecD [Actinomycetia bacterium]|nr:protein-export rane protein SecD [Actinomycetes bacterium]
MRKNVWLLATTIVVIVAALFATIMSGNSPVLGLDLQGGISVRFHAEGNPPSSSIDKAKDIISQRVNALGVAEPEISRQGKDIIVDLPGVKDRDKAKRLVGKTALLTFREVLQTTPIAASSSSSTTTTTTKAAGSTTTAGTATTAPPTSTTAPGAVSPAELAALGANCIGGVGDTGKATTTTAAPTTTAPTTTAAPGTTAGSTTTASAGGAGRSRPRQTTGGTDPVATTKAGTTTTTAAATTTTAKGKTSTTKAPTTTTAPLPTKAILTTNGGDQAHANQVVILPGRPQDKPPVAYILCPAALTGKNVSGATATFISGGGSQGGWGVDATFRNGGAQFVSNIAQPLVNKQVAIVLDGVVQSAPTINAGITGSNVRISGSFTEGDAKDLATVLKFGALPVRLTQLSSESVSPSLGKDQLHAGIVAGLIGLALVALYMFVYYRLLGLVVWLGLAMTAAATYSIVVYLGQTIGLSLTLSGVTGLIVSVGITVDSYVVYFERLKDEVRTGKTVRSSVDRGFVRSFKTIVAADLVSLIGAGALYFLAIGDVRGFAFFLGLSTLLDLVISYTFMHPLVSLMARKPSLVRMRNVGIAAGLDSPEVVA